MVHVQNKSLNTTHYLYCDSSELWEGGNKECADAYRIVHNRNVHFSLQEVGPTMVGDEHSDPNLMNYLGATKRNMLGNHL